MPRKPKPNPYKRGTKGFKRVAAKRAAARASGT